MLGPSGGLGQGPSDLVVEVRVGELGPAVALGVDDPFGHQAVAQGGHTRTGSTGSGASLT